MKYFIGIIVLGIIGLGMGTWHSHIYWRGWADGRESNDYLEEELQKSAIKAKVAEWQINPETGEKRFAWKLEESE